MLHSQVACDQEGTHFIERERERERESSGDTIIPKLLLKQRLQLPTNYFAISKEDQENVIKKARQNEIVLRFPISYIILVPCVDLRTEKALSIFIFTCSFSSSSTCKTNIVVNFHDDDDQILLGAWLFGSIF
jgi:hypothetical protein